MNTSIKLRLATVLGTTLQWYDFSIFGFLAPVIAKNYFPNSSHTAALLNTFVIFAVGFILAPIGSIFFGYLGDRHGRKTALITSIILMGIPTGLIAVLPSYQAIGILAPIILTALRITQGFVASSEFSSSAVFLIEHAPANKKSFFGSLTSSAYSSGLILGALITALLTTSLMPLWSWRLSFALSLLGCFLILLLRRQLQETHPFQNLTFSKKDSLPLFRAIKESPGKILITIGFGWLSSIITFGTFVYMPTYLHVYSHFSLSHAIFLVTIALGVDASLEPFIALAADKIGPYKIILSGILGIMLFSLPIFHGLNSHHHTVVMLSLISMSVLIAITYAPLNAYMVNLFPPEYRCSGFSFAFNLSISIFGGTTPLLLSWLITSTGNPLAPAAYYIFGSIVASVALYCSKNTEKVKLKYV